MSTRSPAEREDVLGVVRDWARNNPASYRSVHGSPLEIELSELTSMGDDRWHVYVPETQPVGLPMGLELLVDLSDRSCEPCAVE